MASQKKTGIFASISTALFVWFVTPIIGEKFSSYEVFDIDNGDTIRVLNQFNKLIKVKLFKIKGHKAAQNTLARKILGKNVELQITGKDESGQTMAIVTYNKRNINLELVAEGLAYNDSKDSQFVEAEQAAQKKKLGIWKDGRIANRK